MDGLLGYLTPEQQKQAQQQARIQGLLSLGAALSQASVGAPGQPKPRLGQVIGQALPVGMQGYQGSIDETLKQIVAGQQMQELQRKRQQEALRQQQLETFVGTLPADQQSRFRAFPEQAAEAMFREPKNAPGVIGEYNAAVQAGLVPSGTTLEQFVEMKKPPGTTVNVPVNVSTEKKYGEALGSQIAQDDTELLKTARAAPQQLQTVAETRKLLEDGKVFTGKFANEKLQIAAAGQALGVTGKDTNEIISNTQRLMANRAQATLDSIRASGLGAGQGFTDKDRQFLENARLGRIDYTPEALKTQLDIEERVAKGAITKWNSRLKNIPKSAVEGTGIGPVEVPSTTQAQPRMKRYNPATEKVE